MLDTKLRPKKQKCGHVNTTNRNSYLNISCIKLVTQLKKLKKELKFGLVSSF